MIPLTGQEKKNTSYSVKNFEPKSGGFFSFLFLDKQSEKWHSFITIAARFL